ncbi:LamB/YcsF family protein [Gilvibacter sediminis]|uniref:LamB/YcsF family protein n=1 Tax=Gilvibacter sediminis TaxID=379071 RepID=UPI00235024D4|nr:LamB/YcsF family protein [Gilvibacter sediminis]MDC7998105.1 LamB/YcsF family protein [Gilvibacter sediminis]
MDGLKRTIDLNADVGEGVSTEPQLMPLISSCNVACGGHYGDRDTILTTLERAKNHKVRVGAHPGYPDKANFGRVVLEISPEALTDSICDQLTLFIDCCKQLDIPMHHIKPHGALYNQAARDMKVAQAFLNALERLALKVPIYTLPNGVLHNIAKGQFSTVSEAFVDRRYHNDGSLVSRKLKGAVVEDPAQAWLQLRSMIFTSSLNTWEDETLSIQADTYCVHGDTPGALDLLRHIHRQFDAHNLILAS